MEENKKQSSQNNSQFFSISDPLIRDNSFTQDCAASPLLGSPKQDTVSQRNKQSRVEVETPLNIKLQGRIELKQQIEAQRASKGIQSERKNTSLQQRVKFIVFGGNSQAFITSVLKKLRPKWIEVTGEQNVENCTFIWKPTHMTPIVSSYLLKMLDQVFKNERVRVYNHIQNIRGLTTKTGLVKSMKHYYKDERTAREVRYTAWETMPTSFLLAAQNLDFQFKQFCQRFKELAQGYSTRERMPLKHCERNMWLVKPAAMNQGRGIQIFKNLIDIQTFINSKTLNSHFIVQKYLEKPLLFHNYKFDIRVWVLLTWKNEVLFFKRGYLRLSSFEYSANPADLSVHLTNQMLQKKFDNYGKVYEGNAIGFEEFEEYLSQLFPDNNINVQEQIVSRMKDMIIDSFLSVKKNLNPMKRKDVFQLLGYDFMIDEDLRTWLIEV